MAAVCSVGAVETKTKVCTEVRLQPREPPLSVHMFRVANGAEFYLEKKLY